MKQLRPFQVESHIALLSDFKKNNQSVLLCLPTGTGKTFTTTSFIDTYNDELDINYCLWITHKEELIDQSALSLMLSCAPDELAMAIITLYEQCDESYLELLRFVKSNISNLFLAETLIDAVRWISENMGLIKQNVFMPEKKIVLASVQTLINRLDQLQSVSYGMIVIDEAHLALAPTWRTCINVIQHKYRLGLTATPERMDGISMSNLFGKISYEYSLFNAIQQGYLCEIDAYRIRTNVNLDNVKTTAGELNAKDLRIVDNPLRNQLAVDEYKRLLLGRKTLAFTVDMEHAVNLKKKFIENGVNADLIVSDKNICPDRREPIQKFTKGDTDILINVEMLTTGFDYPEIGGLMMLRPTKSKTLYSQMVGRGTRLKNADFVQHFGQNMIVLDFVDVTSKHNLINTFTLEDGKPIQEKCFITKEKKEAFLMQLEKQRRESKIDRITDQNVRINLIVLPDMTVKYDPRMQYESMTEKQAEILRKAGYDLTTTEFTKAQAFEIIGRQPANFSECAMLKQWGYDVTKGVTKFQAAQVMKTMSEKFAKDAAKRQAKREQVLESKNKTPKNHE